MKFLFRLIVCTVLVINLSDVVIAGRGRSSGGGRSHSTHTSHSTNSRGRGGSSGGWFNWLRGGSNKATTSNSRPVSRPMTPSFNHKSTGFPSASHQHGFTAYGRNYATNYYSGHQPVSHPFQSHFHPPTTCMFISFFNLYFICSFAAKSDDICVYGFFSAVFAYHFIPIPIHHHHDHYYYHYYGSSGPTTPNHVYYDYRNTTEPTRHEPILYNYKAPTTTNSTAATSNSSEEDAPIEAINSNDYLIAGRI